MIQKPISQSMFVEGNRVMLTSVFFFYPSIHLYWVFGNSRVGYHTFTFEQIHSLGYQFGYWSEITKMSFQLLKISHQISHVAYSLITSALVSFLHLLYVKKMFTLCAVFPRGLLREFTRALKAGVTRRCPFHSITTNCSLKLILIQQILILVWVTL